MWVFGYGSLVWKIDFPYEERVVGYIKGYTRKFWQASIDHRGTPEKPGVVVTLLKTGNPEDVVWGVAYRVHESVVGEGSALGQREIRYTERLWLPFYTKENNLMEEKVLVFYGTNDDTLQLGPRPLSQMAAQIANAVGPSGSNSEYLFKLAKFLREQTPEGEGSEVFELERTLKNMLINKE